MMCCLLKSTMVSLSKVHHKNTTTYICQPDLHVQYKNVDWKKNFTEKPRILYMYMYVELFIAMQLQLKFDI